VQPDQCSEIESSRDHAFFRVAMSDFRGAALKCEVGVFESNRLHAVLKFNIVAPILYHLEVPSCLIEEIINVQRVARADLVD